MQDPATKTPPLTGRSMEKSSEIKQEANTPTSRLIHSKRDATNTEQSNRGVVTANHARSKLPTEQTQFINELRLYLCTELQTSLKVDNLLQIFFSRLEHLIGIAGVEFAIEKARPTSSITDTVVQIPIAGEPACIGAHAIHTFCYQLNTKDHEVGTLTCYSRKRIDRLNIEVLEAAISTLIYPLHNAVLFQRTLASAEADYLTNLGNRDALDKTLPNMVASARRYQQPLSVLMIDIDQFKNINDQYGHNSGDQVIIALADAIRAIARDSDIAFRFGGDEFLILLGNTDSKGAAAVAERLRKRVESLRFGENASNSFTISLGSAVLNKEETPSALILRADQALYRAKTTGRNCSVLA